MVGMRMGKEGNEMEGCSVVEAGGDDGMVEVKVGR